MMRLSDAKSGHWFGVLCICLLGAILFFGIPARYPEAIVGASGLLFFLMCWAAWAVAGRAASGDDDAAKGRAVAGMLLIAPFAIFAWAPGFGPPNTATHAQNETRYAMLLLSSLLEAAGFVLLIRTSLSSAAERFYSSLCFAFAMLAAPLYGVFCAVQLTYYKALAEGINDKNLLSLFNTVSEILLDFGAVLSHLGAACLALSLARAGLLARGSSRTIQFAALILVFSLGVAKAISPGWFELPLFVAAIPAVPWIMPALMGLALLKRASQIPA